MVNSFLEFCKEEQVVVMSSYNHNDDNYVFIVYYQDSYSVKVIITGKEVARTINQNGFSIEKYVIDLATEKRRLHLANN